MDLHFIQEFLSATLRELSNNRLIASIAFGITCIVVVSLGLFWPMPYQTSAVLYVDERNIIKPLLSGQAEIQELDQSQVAREKIYTRAILEKVALQAGLLDENSDPIEISSTVNMLSAGALGLRSGIQIESNGKNFIALSYKDPDPEISFGVINSLIDVFIRNIAESKRGESKSAFDFIEGQAEIYKKKLEEADENLKRFNSENRDGTEEAVTERIATLRVTIEDISLTIDELSSRYRTLQKQISSESEYLNVRSRTDVYRERIQEAQSRQDNMLLSLTATHPDVVSLQLQIEDLKQAIIDIESNTSSQGGNDTSSQLLLNPLMEELRSNLSDTEIELNATKNRKRALQRQLKGEYQRSERIAERQAELSDLTRDYNVTQKLYEDMLNRREKARLSMTLDIEGQGTSYKVHEPPTFPLTPSGLSIEHFILSAPAAGILVPLGIIALFIFFDPRIRLPSDLSMIEGAEMLAITIPAKNASSSHNMNRDTLWCTLILIGSSAVYIWISLTLFTRGAA